MEGSQDPVHGSSSGGGATKRLHHLAIDFLLFPEGAVDLLCLVSAAKYRRRFGVDGITPYQPWVGWLGSLLGFGYIFVMLCYIIDDVVVSIFF